MLLTHVSPPPLPVSEQGEPLPGALGSNSTRNPHLKEDCAHPLGWLGYAKKDDLQIVTTACPFDTGLRHTVRNQTNTLQNLHVGLWSLVILAWTLTLR